jgi:hypothetical protein
MKIGIDFDNTIVRYDEVFHRVALDKSLIPQDLPKNKVAVRDYLRAKNQENEWTLMQGEVYGPKLKGATPYPGFTEFITKASSLGCQLYIVSHKTKFPFMGPAYDLHMAAKSWVSSTLTRPDGMPYFSSTNVYYELTKEEKISRISQLNCDVFIDDLPEILMMDGYPSGIKKVLFDPEQMHTNISSTLTKASAWSQVQELLLK